MSKNLLNLKILLLNNKVNKIFFRIMKFMIIIQIQLKMK